MAGHAASQTDVPFQRGVRFAAWRSAARPDAVVGFARSHGLEVPEITVVGRTVVLSGTIEQVNDAFHVTLNHYQSDAGPFRSHEGPIHAPNELADVIVAVFGLNTWTEGRHNNGGDPSGATVLTPQTVAQLYNFPATPPDASGAVIGVIEFSSSMLGIGDGPCGWNPTDVNDTLFFWSGVNKSFAPEDVPVTGTNNVGDKFNPHEPDSEVLLDICVAEAIAPGARVRVYWGSDTTSANDWLKVLNYILAESPANLPHALSNSWVLAPGDDALGMSNAQVKELSSKFQSLAALGVTVFSASGDDGSRCLLTDGNAHVQYPASDQWVTSCGGTTISTNPSFVEWVLNDTNPNTSRPFATGGGVSAIFPIPPWQQLVSVPPSINPGNAIGRGVPDVAGNASVTSGYNLTLYGNQIQNGGTSAVAPLYAGLAALLFTRLGSRIGFLNPTLYSFRDAVCRDINDQLFPGSPQTNGVPAYSDPNTGKSWPATKGYPTGPGWDACTGLGVINGGALLAALQGVFAKNLQFILDRTEFGEAEVSATLTSASPGVIPNAFYVVVDGFSATDLGIAPSDLYPSPPSVAPVFSASVSGMSIAATGLLAEDVSLPPKIPQRFTWVCSANFKTDLSAFNPTPPPPIPVTLMAKIQGVSDSATVDLVAQADPYELDGAVSWLSTDLRVFQMASGSSLPGLPAVTLKNTGDPQTDAPTFIKAVIDGLNGNSAPPNAFDQISTDEQVSEVTLDWNPSSPVYNFAVARVRYQSNVASSKVRAFFRLYRAATTSTAYEPQTYAAVSNSGVSMSGLIPVFGVDGGGDLVAIPCFADQRVTPGTSLSTQTDDKNVLLNGIQPAPGNGVAYVYFGCWLDINQAMTGAVPKSPVPAGSANPWANGSQSVLAAITGQHQCLIAEISYDADPVQDGETPASSDKLAQRNLAVVQSANPGNPASHRIPHTFDIRPTAKLAAGAPVDELMIDWGNTPRGSSARLYLPSVGAAAVLDLAAEMYPTHRLRQVDSSTLQCPTGGATWVPVPQGGGSNFAALLTVDLPATVRKGQAFTIVVRQVTSDTGARQFDRRSSSAATATRRVLGTFQLTIPVSTEEALLEPEERLLAIMRWIEEGIPANDRWSPVVARYVAQIADRVQGFGGDPGQILPSPTGDGIPKHRHREPKPEKRIVFTGKIAGLVFDRFGDFEGFLLDSEDGERAFHSGEREIEELAERAWRERLRVTVRVDRDEPHRPMSIIIR